MITIIKNVWKLLTKKRKYQSLLNEKEIKECEKEEKADKYFDMIVMKRMLKSWKEQVNNSRKEKIKPSNLSKK